MRFAVTLGDNSSTALTQSRSNKYTNIFGTLYDKYVLLCYI